MRSLNGPPRVKVFLRVLEQQRLAVLPPPLCHARAVQVHLQGRVPPRVHDERAWQPALALPKPDAVRDGEALVQVLDVPAQRGGQETIMGY